MNYNPGWTRAPWGAGTFTRAWDLRKAFFEGPRVLKLPAMARSKKDRRPPPRVVKRDASERKEVPADLEAFASGDDDALWRRPARKRLKDPRAVMLVPGVANRDARTVYHAREKRMRAAIEAENTDALTLELREAIQLRLWRGNSIVSREAFVEDILGLGPDAAPDVDAEPENDEVVATWMRAEAGLLEAIPDGAVRLVDGQLVLAIPVESAPAALAGMGRRAAPLAKDETGARTQVVDRPKGVRRISEMVDRPTDDD